jgi:hypothetical protein
MPILIHMHLDNFHLLFRKISKKINCELHLILTFKIRNNSECINRDNNATLNIYKIVKSLMEHKKRPEEYCQKIKILTNVG